jgi:hypothetical protein
MYPIELVITQLYYYIYLPVTRTLFSFNITQCQDLSRQISTILMDTMKQAEADSLACASRQCSTLFLATGVLFPYDTLDLATALERSVYPILLYTNQSNYFPSSSGARGTGSDAGLWEVKPDNGRR